MAGISRDKGRTEEGSGRRRGRPAGREGGAEETGDCPVVAPLSWEVGGESRAGGSLSQQSGWWESEPEGAGRAPLRLVVMNSKCSQAAAFGMDWAKNWV